MENWKMSGWQKLLMGSGFAMAVMISACQDISQDTAASPSGQIGPETTDVAPSVPVRVNQIAPDFSGVDSTGALRKLSEFKGKTVVLEWTNHQCPFTGKHYTSGNMQRLQAEATDQGIVWLSIISSAPGQQGYVTAEEANQLTTSRDASPTAVILDPEGEIGRLYSARTTPHMYVIDPQGELRYMGGIDNIPSADPADVTDATNYVQGALTSLGSDLAVDPAVTQPYGCSIKYSL